MDASKAREQKVGRNAGAGVPMPFRAFHCLFRRLLPFALVAHAAACAEGEGDPPEFAEIDSQTQAVVYDNDDRLEVFEDRSEAADLATRSVVALIPSESIEQSDGSARADPTRVEDLQNLCEGEPFAGQPAAARCSGVLIDDDLVLTAGHCFADGDPCDVFAYVFNYHYNRRDQPLDITDLDVYGCKRTVAREHGVRNGFLLDFAIVQLDRPVRSNRSPAELAPGLPALGEPITVIGCSQGLPQKIDPGAVVRSVVEQAGFWTLNSDTFGGSSGSPAFDSEGRVAGILVQGQDDYELDTTGNCLKARRVKSAAADMRYERAADLRAAMQALCEEDSSRRFACAAPLVSTNAPIQGYVACHVHARPGGPKAASIAAFCAIGASLVARLRRREKRRRGPR